MSQTVCGAHVHCTFIPRLSETRISRGALDFVLRPESGSQQPRLLKQGYLRPARLRLVCGTRFCQMRLLRGIGFQVSLSKLPRLDGHNTLLVFLAVELAFHECVPRGWAGRLLFSLAPGCGPSDAAPLDAGSPEFAHGKILSPWNQATRAKQLYVKFGGRVAGGTF